MKKKTPEEQAAAERERVLMEAFNVLLANHYWVEGPAGSGPQLLCHTRLSHPGTGTFIGIREEVKLLEATDPAAAVLEAAAYVKTLGP
jgi:hypothetical protein